MTNLPPIDFTAKDAEQYKQDAIDIIPDIAPDWTDFSDTDLGIAILSLVSRIAGNLGFAIDRAANEAIFVRALERKNVIDGARSLGYYPKHYISSIVMVQFDFGGSEEITIPRNTRLSTTGEPRIDFVTGSERFTDSMGVADDVVCFQGIPNRNSFTAVGVANERISLSPSDVSEGTDHIEIEVGGSSEWERQVSFVNSDSGSKHFVVETDGSGITSIVFGNGAFGQIPAPNSTVVVDFLRSAGRFGNVGTGKINRVVSSLSNSTSRVYPTITNSESAKGGADPETIDQIKRRAPAFLATQGRAVTKAGYISIIEAIDGVERVNAWGESEENPPNVKMFNVVKIAAVIDDSVTPKLPVATKESINDVLEGDGTTPGVGLLTVTYRYFSPVYVPIHLDIDYEVVASFVADNVGADIKEAFESYFRAGNRSFGEKIQYSTMVLLASGRLEGYIFEGVRSVSVKMFKQPYIVSENGADYAITSSNRAFSYTIDGGTVSGTLTIDSAATAAEIVAVINTTFGADVAFVVGDVDGAVAEDVDSSKGRIMLQSPTLNGATGNGVTINAGTSNDVLGFTATDTDTSDSQGRTDISLRIDQFPYVDVETDGTVSIEVMT